MITRRAAILACLMAPLMKPMQGVKNETFILIAIDIPENNYEPCSNSFTVGPCGEYEKYYALSVTYKGETINITPEELMKALGGD